MQENALANTWIVQNCNMNANLKERTWIVQNYIFFFKPEIVVLVRGTAIDLNGPDYIYIGVFVDDNGDGTPAWDNQFEQLRWSIKEVKMNDRNHKFIWVWVWVSCLF